MLLIVVPVALLAAFVLYVGAKDVEERKHQEADSVVMHTLEDSVRYFEDGF